MIELRRDRGFTILELLIVVSILVLLMTLALPGVMRAMNRSQLTKASEIILRCHSQARVLSLTQPPVDAANVPGPVVPGTTRHYGVRINATASPIVVEVIYGTSETSAVPVSSYTLPGYVVLKTAVSPQAARTQFTGTMSWFYNFGRGFPIKSTAAAQVHVPIDIGLPGWASTTDPNYVAQTTVTTPWGADTIGAKWPPSYPASVVQSGGADLTVGYLEVASIDDTFRQRIVILRNGLASSQEP